MKRAVSRRSGRAEARGRASRFSLPPGQGWMWIWAERDYDRRWYVFAETAYGSDDPHPTHLLVRTQEEPSDVEARFAGAGYPTGVAAVQAVFRAFPDAFPATPLGRKGATLSPTGNECEPEARAGVISRRGRAARPPRDLEDMLAEASPRAKERLLRRIADPYQVGMGAGARTIWASRGKQPFIVDENDRVWHSLDEYIGQGWGDWLEELFPLADQEFNADFWDSPPPLYHATTEELAEAIERAGLEARYATRGISNRGVGGAVFTTTDLDEAVQGCYGEVIFGVDTRKMKRSGDTPFVSQEPDIEKYELERLLAAQLDYDDYIPSDIESGMSLWTIIVHGSIGPQYLRRVP